MNDITQAGSDSTIAIFDANCMLGGGSAPGPGAPCTALQMLAEMQRVGIQRALVYHHLAARVNPQSGNLKLLEEICGLAEFSPAWVVTPSNLAQIEPRKWVKEMLREGVKAARLLPYDHMFELRMWNAGRLLEALAERKIPVWVDYGMSSWTDNRTDWNGLAEVLQALPGLRVVLVRPDISSGRRLFALMERYANLLIETSYYTVHQGLSEVCRLFGAQRVLFGSGLPGRAAGAALTALMYQSLSDEERRMIASQNLNQLLSEVLDG